MTRITAMLLVGLGATAVSGCYIVSPYAAPAYGPVPPPPPPPPGAGPPPGSPPPAGPPPSAMPGQPPGGPGAAPGSEAGCPTVTVEGHYETRVRADGQRETVWIPTHVVPMCQ